MIDHLLPFVRKPIRYTNQEMNLPKLNKSKINICLAFPDIYELGMSNLGIKILYHVLAQAGVHVERVFAPWIDFGNILRKTDTPLVALETKTPINQFDIIGFSVHTELSATTIMYMLDLANIPLRSKDRDENHPLIIGGGPVAYNPLPLAPFFDAFVIGDGEEVILEIVKSTEPQKKDQTLKRWSKIEGVYVPAIHKNKKIKKRTIDGLKEEFFPTTPILPICELTHDRLTIEAARGCLWGCRFCQAGFVNRPLRVRKSDEMLKLAERGIRKTGWEEVSLLAFSILDYPHLNALLARLMDNLSLRSVGVSLPSIRGELLNEDMLKELSRIGRSGLTFAPEAGSERLRKIINKPINIDHLYAILKRAYALGWRQIKFYFLIGLPEEEDSDIDDLINMINTLGKIAGRRGVKVSISPFIPKPHTPFQWETVFDCDEMMEKIRKIKKSVRGSNIRITYHNPESSYVESLIARGDKGLARVIEGVFNDGGHFEEWTEQFNFKRWVNVAADLGVDLKKYHSLLEKTPWDFIDVGVEKKFLIQEKAKAGTAEITDNCATAGCQGCGACTGEQPSTEKPFVRHHSETPQKKPISTPVRYRLKYTVGDAYRYASHRDIMRSLYRTFRRSDLPVVYSRGYNPHPKISFGPPKPVGVCSNGEYLDLKLNHYYFGNIVAELNSAFPPDLRAISIRPIKIATTSLSKLINIHHYVIEGNGLNEQKFEKILNADKAILERKKNGNTEYIDIKQDIFRINYDGKLDLYVYFGKWRAKIGEIINYLYGESKIGDIKITRLDQMILSQGKLITPLDI